MCISLTNYFFHSHDFIICYEERLAISTLDADHTIGLNMNPIKPPVFMVMNWTRMQLSTNHQCVASADDIFWSASRVSNMLTNNGIRFAIHIPNVMYILIIWLWVKDGQGLSPCTQLFTSAMMSSFLRMGSLPEVGPLINRWSSVTQIIPLPAVGWSPTTTHTQSWLDPSWLSRHHNQPRNPASSAASALSPKGAPPEIPRGVMINQHQ